MKKSKLGMLVLFLLISTGYWGVSNAVLAWPVENGVAICTSSDLKYIPEIVSDGYGGAIITWMDWRTDDWDIFAQSVDSTGALRWNLDGVAICTASGRQDCPQIVSDGQGGAIITWMDSRDGLDIYAQAIDSSGNVKWSSNGILISDNTCEQPQLVSDGQGGAVIIWWDYRNSPGGWGTNDIYAQAVDSTGLLKWSLDGVAICTASGSQEYPDIVSDGQDGAIITWVDYRTGDYDIYAQAIDGNGKIKWAIDGLIICTAYGGQNYPRIFSDEQKGAIITWMDYRNGNCDIYAQAINSTGIVKWGQDGVAVSNAPNAQEYTCLATDGHGGAIIAWNDQRNGTGVYDVYVQSIDSTGITQWSADGIPVCTASGNQFTQSIIHDGENGTIIVWQDERNGNWDIYAQNIDSVGLIKWGYNGIPICVASNTQTNPRIDVNGYGGAVITWEDYRNGSRDIYAQSINSDGIVPIELSGFEVEY